MLDPDTFPLPEASGPGTLRNALRLYGACCISGNVLVLIKGVGVRDPLIIASGVVGTLAQVTNAARGNIAKPYTVPALITAASLFLAAGIHSGNLSHIAFGGLKAVGLATLFYACRGPAAALIARLRGVPPELAGEVMLGIASSSLGYDGCRELAQGIGAHHLPTIVNGAITVAASAGFIAGQRFASLLQRDVRLNLQRSYGGGLAARGCEK